MSEIVLRYLARAAAFEQAVNTAIVDVEAGDFVQGLSEKAQERALFEVESLAAAEDVATYIRTKRLVDRVNRAHEILGLPVMPRADALRAVNGR